MISTDAALGIGVVALGIVLTPGPNMVYLVSCSITQGRAGGMHRPEDRWRSVFAVVGLVTNLLNPKIAVLYVTLLPQFIDPDRGLPRDQPLRNQHPRATQPHRQDNQRTTPRHLTPQSEWGGLFLSEGSTFSP